MELELEMMRRYQLENFADDGETEDTLEYEPDVISSEDADSDSEQSLREGTSISHRQYSEVKARLTFRHQFRICEGASLG